MSKEDIVYLLMILNVNALTTVGAHMTLTDFTLSCMTDWKTAPTHFIAGMNELYQQMNQRRSTTRAKQGLRRDIMSCVGCVARLRKPKHMYLQGAVNWPIKVLYTS